MIYAGELAGRFVVSIEHADGLRTTFEPVSPSVSRGDRVAAGTPVGTLLPGHEADCLHWGVKTREGDYLNPLSLMMPAATLRPWSDPALS